MAQYRVAIDAGHGGSDPGAVYGSRREKDDTLRLANAVGRILEQNGVDVFYVRTDDEYETPFKKATDANNAGVDYFVSIHRNSSEEPNQYDGIETLVYNDDGVKATMARNINAELEKVGFRNLGVDERPNLVVLRRTQMPAVLVEAGFINSDKDNRIFDDNFETIAQGIADGILDTLYDNRNMTQSVKSTFYDDFDARNSDKNRNANRSADAVRRNMDDADSGMDNGMNRNMNDDMMNNRMSRDMDDSSDGMNENMNDDMMDNRMNGNMGDMNNGMSGNMGDMNSGMNGTMGDMNNGMSGNMGDMNNGMNGNMDMPTRDRSQDMDADRTREVPQTNGNWTYEDSNDTEEQPQKLYRVQVGAYRNKESADRMLNGLLIEGFPAFVILDNGIYKVQVGAFCFLANAIKMEEKLRRYRYNTFITI